MTDERLEELLKEALKPEIEEGDLAFDQTKRAGQGEKELSGFGRRWKWVLAAASAALVCLIAFGITSGMSQSGTGPTAKTETEEEVGPTAETEAKQEVKQAETAAETDENAAEQAARSQIYTDEDIAAAEAVVKQEFATWDGVENLQLTYMGDACDSVENISWMNDLKEGQKLSGARFTQCIAFVSTFHAKSDAAPGTWNADSDYDGYSWYLARSDGGEWQLMTWGY